VTVAPAPELVGRDGELARVDAFADGLAAGAAALVLEGEPGIGKSELWLYAVSAAAARGCRVLEARPAEAERELGFAGLADLLGAVRAHVAGLPPPQRRPLAVALLLEEADGAPPDARAIGAATLGLLRRVGRAQPVVVAVDDVQWLDRASAAALSFALRRAAGERLGVVLARRSESPSPLALDAALPQERIELGPLSLGATRRLLADRLGADFPRSTLRRVHERAGGNPFFALELARALQARGGAVGPDGELPLPGDLRRLVRDRLAALPPASAESLAAVAALGEPPLRLVADDAALEPAFEAGVLLLDGDRVRFAHPLLAAAAYGVPPPAARRALHRRLAALVDEPEQRARHLALGADAPDEELAAVLDRAAEHAARRGAPEAAAELAEHALRLTAADVDAAASRAAAAAGYHVVAGDDRRARELLEEALGGAAAGPPRARLLFALGHASANTDLERALALFRDAAAEAAGDEHLEAEILGLFGSFLTATRGVAEGEPHLRAAVAAAERAGDHALLACSLAALAANQFLLGRGVDEAALERALALEPFCDAVPIGERPVTRFGWMCKHAGDVDRSRALLAEACRLGEERGDAGVAEPLFYSCFLELYAENWRHGVELAGRICELADETERPDHRLHALFARAVLLGHLGDEAGARRDEREALAIGARIGSSHGRGVEGMALGVVELARDRPALALEPTRRSREFFLADGVEEPGMHVSFPVHAEAAIAVGELAEAEALLDWIEERAVRLDREWALACAARCRGLLAAARGDEAGALAAFERALAEHARVQYRRFDLARTLLARGETLRRFRRKRPARESIEAALPIFDELGAALWSAKARRELARISGRRSAEGLTETERRVAELVAGGMSTKEAAAALVVSPKTVEGHLSRIYAKLDVRSRTQLAQRLERD
jgi:DNA-binding CsgD family transcriptional regulator